MISVFGKNYPDKRKRKLKTRKSRRLSKLTEEEIFMGTIDVKTIINESVNDVINQAVESDTSATDNTAADEISIPAPIVATSIAAGLGALNFRKILKDTND